MAIGMTLDGAAHEVEIVRLRPRLTLRVDGRLHEVDGPGPDGDGPGALVIDGAAVAFDRAGDDASVMVRIAGRTLEIGHIDPRAEAAGAAAAAEDEIRAPMPGLVVAVGKAAGEAVAAGDLLVTIESMKLQTALPSPRAGLVAEVLRAAGESFDKDAVLIRLRPEEG